MIQTFNEFMDGGKSHRHTAGIAILFDGKILLVHPKNGSWVRPIMGIPKGKIEDGENPMAAAIRETREETGISIEPAQLELAPQTVEVHDKSGNYRNTIYYYVCRISNLAQIGLDSLSVPKSQLQTEEVDWAGFVTVQEAYGKIVQAQRIILDRIS
jgi:predicted NUDIX family NTP pyrophosphohydrolase